MNKPCYSVTIELYQNTNRRSVSLGRNVHHPTDEPGVIVLSDKLQFDKVLQKQLPPDPDSIATSEE